MRGFLLLVLLLAMTVCVLAQSKGAANNSRKIINGEEIVNKSLDQFFRDWELASKNYKYRTLEKDKTIYVKDSKLDSYHEKLYEHIYLKNKMMRKQLQDEKGILKTPDIFRPFEEDVKFDRDFFNRFNYQYRETKNGIIILEFSPKDNLQVKHYLDKAINKLIGTIEVRESDLVFLKLSGHLPENSNVQILFVVIDSLNVSFKTREADGSVLVDSCSVTANYHKILGQQKRREWLWQFQDYGNLVSADPIQPEYSNRPAAIDHFLPRYLWSKATLGIWLAIIGGIATFVIVFIKKKRNKKS